MTFEVCYKETTVGWFPVEADNELAAYDKFWQMVEDGEIDLLAHMEIVDSNATVYTNRNIFYSVVAV